MEVFPILLQGLLSQMTLSVLMERVLEMFDRSRCPGSLFNYWSSMLPCPTGITGNIPNMVFHVKRRYISMMYYWSIHASVKHGEIVYDALPMESYNHIDTH